MKLSCKVIEDLLPMYYDKVCSEESAVLVEKHLENCPHCSHILSELRTDVDIPAKEPDDIKPLKRIQKSYKKMRMYWLIAIAVMLALIPIAFFVGNDFSEHVDAYSAEEALAGADTFMTCLVEGDYAKAYSYMDFENITYNWREYYSDKNDLANFEADGLKRFCEAGQLLEAIGGIEKCEYYETRASGYASNGDKVYYIYYKVKIAGRIERVDVTVGKNGIHHIGLTIARTEHPLSQLCYWDQWVFDNYWGRYYDYDLKDYVYYDK